MTYLDRYDVFRASRVLCDHIGQLTAGFERGEAKLRDQLRRSSLSIVLNVAEGLGRLSPGEKRRCYVIARGEVHETRAALVVASLRGQLDERQLGRLDRLADRIGGMLWKMIGRFRE